MSIRIKNGLVVDPQSELCAQQDLFIHEGKVAALGQRPDGLTIEHEIDAQGCVICPGLVDLSVRLREPGYEYRATLESEVAAAIAGGVTSLACPPDTDPPLDEPGLVEMLKHRARSLSYANVHPIGALTVGLAGEKITEMAELFEAGCLAFAQTTRLPTNTEVLYRAMQYGATFGFSVWLQPQDAHLGRDGFAHDGEVASRLGLAAIPASSEAVTSQSTTCIYPNGISAFLMPTQSSCLLYAPRTICLLYARR
jgi:dihydroorotase